MLINHLNQQQKCKIIYIIDSVKKMKERDRMGGEREIIVTICLFQSQTRYKTNVIIPIAKIENREEKKRRGHP